VEEGEAVTATKAKYGNITLEMRKLRTDIRVTDEFLADRPALEVHVLDVLSKEARFIIGDAICNGSGTTKPLGIVNSNALITVTPESGHALGTINAADLKSMMSRCWPASMANAIWVMNIDGFAEIADISFSNGQPVVQYIGNRRFVLGCEVYICEYAGTLGTVGDIFLIDPTQYVLGNRGSQLSLSLHVYFDTGEGLFRFTWRLDGQPLWDAPIAPRGVSYTCSPFIALDTR
jgi:HK97 family phage major capsid protein